MDKAIFLPSLVISVPLMAFYFLRCRKNGEQFNLAVMVNSVLQSSGIVCGMLLILSTLSDQVKQIVSGIDLYVFIGGAAVIVVSIQGIHKDMFSGNGKNEIAEVDVPQRVEG